MNSPTLLMIKRLIKNIALLLGILFFLKFYWNFATHHLSSAKHPADSEEPSSGVNSDIMRKKIS